MHVINNYLTTILSLKYANNIPVVRVTMDTLIEKAMNLILGDGTVFKFKEGVSRLYYYDMESTDEQNSAKTNATTPPTNCYQL